MWCDFQSFYSKSQWTHVLFIARMLQLWCGYRTEHDWTVKWWATFFFVMLSFPGMKRYLLWSNGTQLMRSKVVFKHASNLMCCFIRLFQKNCERIKREGCHHLHQMYYVFFQELLFNKFYCILPPHTFTWIKLCTQSNT